MKKTIIVSIPEEPYSIHVGHNLLTRPELFKPYLHNKPIFILSHPEIATHYLEALKQTCLEAGALQCDHLLIPSGEKNKSLKTANQIWSHLLKNKFKRDSVVIALGGGMIGDLAGFTAACFMRGIPIIQCPTSLLAQIDASIGGKTAVNHPRGKNMIGVFHQPSLVIADIETLKTLPQREFVAGLGELIKYGMSLDASFFALLEKHMHHILNREQDILSQVVIRACELKAAIVTQDVTDHGQRALLNFGHTIAHAIENLLDYKEWLHGEAVSVGMVVATKLSILEGKCPSESLKRLVNLLTTAGLPTKFPKGITLGRILTKIKYDKKHLVDHMRWVLLKDLGQAYIDDTVTEEKVVFALKNL